jgi:hypothetical protein
MTMGTGAEAQAPDRVAHRDIQLRQPVPEGRGGLFAHDLNGDDRLDLVVTSADHIGAYDQTGEALWVRKADIALFDYLHHPSVIAGDLDGDGRQELAHLTASGRIEVLNAATGAVEKLLSPPGAPVAIAIANLRGEGDREILLQYSATHIAALRADTGEVLWDTEAYRGIEHSPLRQADLDGDGRDEVAGATIIDHDGTKMNEWDLGDVYRNLDSIVIADIVPGHPLEVALAEQRGANSHTDVVNAERIVFRSLNPWNWEDPDKLAVGDFDPERPGLETFNRSSGGDGTARRGDEEPYSNEEAPWVIDAEGRLLSKYYVNDMKPEGWTGHGLEEVCRIDWDGDAADEIVCKERHTNGSGAIVDPLTGAFKEVFPGQAALIYAADLLGDSREEVVLVDERGYLRILWNAQANPNAALPTAEAELELLLAVNRPGRGPSAGDRRTCGRRREKTCWARPRCSHCFHSPPCPRASPSPRSV